jgi:hypothetical protein
MGTSASRNSNGSEPYAGASRQRAGFILLAAIITARSNTRSEEMNLQHWVAIFVDTFVGAFLGALGSTLYMLKKFLKEAARDRALRQQPPEAKK